ncbi:MAG TPA: hypothetical protein VLT61_03515 [Anaeromyxobacteraceae bacterium]|nr:hypothetical protein [Anaeromyxobacteraceae bacterium]
MATSERMWTLPNELRLIIKPCEVLMMDPDGRRIVLALSREDAKAVAMAMWAGVDPMRPDDGRPR